MRLLRLLLYEERSGLRPAPQRPSRWLKEALETAAPSPALHRAAVALFDGSHLKEVLFEDLLF